MRIRWFGESWHAPICEEKYKIEPPLGEICLSCREKVFTNERGVVMAADQGIENSFLVTLQNEYGYLHETRVCAYHIDCFIESVVPGQSYVPRRP